MKILMFSTHSMKCIWYSPQKSKYPLFIYFFSYILGMPVSQGSVKGVARVVLSLEDADKIQVRQTLEIHLFSPLSRLY